MGLLIVMMGDADYLCRIMLMLNDEETEFLW